MAFGKKLLAGNLAVIGKPLGAGGQRGCSVGIAWSIWERTYIRLDHARRRPDREVIPLPVERHILISVPSNALKTPRQAKYLLRLGSSGSSGLNGPSTEGTFTVGTLALPPGTASSIWHSSTRNMDYLNSGFFLSYERRQDRRQT